MMIKRKLFATLGLGIALGLAACGGGNDDDDDLRGDGITVPTDADKSSSNFVEFVENLSATDETSEPLLIEDTFAVPDDETGDPIPLT